MAITAYYDLKLTVQEALTIVDASGDDAKITHNLFNASGFLDADTTPPATKATSFELTLTSGAATIDLTALPSVYNATVDGTGLRVQLVKLKAPATNGNAVTIVPGASNGYNLFGATSKITLQPGEQVEFLGIDLQPEIGNSAKTIDISGTGSQKLDVQLVMG
jgi:hypothetical protein